MLRVVTIFSVYILDANYLFCLSYRCWLSVLAIFTMLRVLTICSVYILEADYLFCLFYRWWVWRGGVWTPPYWRKTSARWTGSYTSSTGNKNRKKKYMVVNSLLRFSLLRALCSCALCSCALALFALGLLCSSLLLFFKATMSDFLSSLFKKEQPWGNRTLFALYKRAKDSK